MFLWPPRPLASLVQETRSSDRMTKKVCPRDPTFWVSCPQSFEGSCCHPDSHLKYEGESEGSPRTKGKKVLTFLNVQSIIKVAARKGGTGLRRNLNTSYHSHLSLHEFEANFLNKTCFSETVMNAEFLTSLLQRNAFQYRAKKWTKVWWILFLLFTTCLKNSRNLGTKF